MSPDPQPLPVASAPEDDLLLNEVEEGWILLGRDGRVRRWNRWMSEHSGLSEDDTRGYRLPELFADLGEALQQAIRDALSSGLCSLLSARLHRCSLPLFEGQPDTAGGGQPLPHSIEISPLRREGGAACLLRVIDARQRLRHEQLLKRTLFELETVVARAREQEFQLKTVLDNTLDAVIILNRMGRISSFYRSAQKMFGYGHYDLLGKPIGVLLPSPYNRRIEQLIRLDEGEGELNFFEPIKALKQGGELFHAELAVSSILEGENRQYIVTIKDITERHATQEELYREKEQAQVTLSCIADGVITTDIIGQITYINPAALKLTGYTEDELLGKRIDRVITIESERSQLPVFECIQAGRQVDSLSGDTLIDKQGEQRVIHQVATPRHNTIGDTVGAVLILRDVSKSHRLANRLSWQATHDELTGLVNRREFERRLEKAIENARDRGSEHCLCFMDLDKFKVVNDTCGHAAGDELLRQLADIFRSRIRGADTLARLGGDEFAIILSECELGPAVNVAENIRAAVEDFRFGWQDQSFQVGISIGLVMVDRGSPDLDEVFKAADSACYAAKDAGRNRVHIYSPNDIEISQRQGEAHWLVRIQNALDEDRFELHYQPIVPIANDDDPVHYEILIRMRSEQGELIPPGAFITSAERYQLMSKIDLWVIEHLFAWIERHWDHRAAAVFAINLSGQSLADESLLYRVKQLIDEHAIAADHVCFEITETAAISNLSQAQLFMDELRDLGCRFALDDFGSGLSSFAYLKSLRVDYLKIDGAFVKDMVEDDIDRAMVESIHNIGSVLKLRTIAEFVEDDAILQALRELGVHFAQGYGIARPRALPRDGQLLNRL
jgi:diguanylate cyclase (GGDEF)-like protein/PAS domain S-box-containing protein